ncbi:hypothetical protein BOX15_Mlig001116g1 [Macrostomum lignano]|uniref:FAM192A/Fyv6 N-terminal domain-containing protein n=1 Tax=Macrostomum lignano TaxID=282301 RepID=A0A267EDZ4_9PLAT|nr:hypothetical protein BOX15_Mlig001116g1 [Macrostomum lignano]
MERRFISEKQLADIAQQRKLERGGQGDEEQEPYDPRSLYERLQEQKDKKQAEYEEQHALRNQVSRITEDEAQFLSDLAKRQAEEERQRRAEDRALIEAYNRAVQGRKPAADPSAGDVTAAPVTVSISVSNSSGAGPKKTSAQRSLLGRAVAVKRKLPTDSAGSNDEASSQSQPPVKSVADSKTEAKPEAKDAAVSLLAAYATDSDSEADEASAS